MGRKEISKIEEGSSQVAPVKTQARLSRGASRRSGIAPYIERLIRRSNLWVGITVVVLILVMSRSTWTISILAVGAGCMVIGYYMGKQRLLLARGISQLSDPGRDSLGNPHEVEKLAEVHDDFKMVLVVRNDLKMGKGKAAAQCSHATLGLYKKILHRAPKALIRWEMCGQVKVVTKTESEEELLALQTKAKALKLPTHITIDAGRTQIAANSRTVMAVLGPVHTVDEVTSHLKLL